MLGFEKDCNLEPTLRLISLHLPFQSNPLCQIELSYILLEFN